MVSCPFVRSTTASTASAEAVGPDNAARGAPELFYRLDLRSQRAPRLLYFSGASDSDLVAYLLLPDATGVPSRVAACQPLSAASTRFSKSASRWAK